jgi:hypothetical protein
LSLDSRRLSLRVGTIGFCLTGSSNCLDADHSGHEANTNGDDEHTTPYVRNSHIIHSLLTESFQNHTSEMPFYTKNIANEMDAENFSYCKKTGLASHGQP